MPLLNKRLSSYDRIALAIAKSRSIPLLTGAKRLKQEAENLDIERFGTIGLLDRFFKETSITQDEYLDCLTLLKGFNGGKIRLPVEEPNSRISKFSQ